MKRKKRNTPRAPAPPVRAGRGWLVAQILLGVAALGAGYLALVSLTSGSLAGCGPESGCSKVLQTQWAYWLGIPVSIPAVFAYLGLAGALWLRGRRKPDAGDAGLWSLIVTLSIVIAGAALWFVGLQVFTIKAFCKFCMTAHGCGFVAALYCLSQAPMVWRAGQGRDSRFPADRGLSPKMVAGLIAVSAAALGVLFAGQVLAPVKRNQVVTLPPAPPPNPVPPPPVLVWPTNPMANPRTNPSALPPPAPAGPPPIVRLVSPGLLSLYDGMFQIKLGDAPLVGSPDAPNVVVSLFDYTCHHCRLLHPLLMEAQRRLGPQLSIVCLPMPLATNCNPVIPRYMPRHRLGCEYAGLGLAVWRAKPAAFSRFDDWLFEPETPIAVADARQYAAQLVGGSNVLDRALSDPWITNQIHAAGRLYATNYLKLRQSVLPQVMMGSSVNFGPLNSVEEVMDLLRRNLGLPPPETR